MTVCDKQSSYVIFETQNGKRVKLPVLYNIHLDLKIVYIACVGLVRARELFEAVDLSNLDSRRKPGMDTVIDLLASDLDFELADMYEGIRYLNELPDEVCGVERLLLVTPSTSLHLLVDTIYLLPAENALKLTAVFTLQDAIIALRPTEHHQEAIQFFYESKNSIQYS